MDEAYNQHSKQRRKNRSTTNLNHLSLAPLTSRLPIADPDALPDIGSLAAPSRHSTSYLQGKSAPTTPGILTRSGARSPNRPRHSVAFGPSVVALGPGVVLPKSKSVSHLTQLSSQRREEASAVSGTTSPNSHKRREETAVTQDGSDGDWLFRAAALMSSEAREFKGQSWLVSRASSTSLTGDREAEEAEEEMSRERDRESRRGSRTGSATNLSMDLSPYGSRHASRSHSRAGSRTHMFTPTDLQGDDEYFPYSPQGEYVPGPDFVNLDERLEALGEESAPDAEAAVRRLVRRRRDGGASWMGNILGWSLFSVEENDEEMEGDSSDDSSSEEGATDHRTGSSTPSALHREEEESNNFEERIPAPRADEGGWKDAAWLLSVATKVLL